MPCTRLMVENHLTDRHLAETQFANLFWRWGDNLPTDNSPTGQLTERKLTDRARANVNLPTAATYRQG